MYADVLDMLRKDFCFERIWYLTGNLCLGLHRLLVRYQLLWLPFFIEEYLRNSESSVDEATVKTATVNKDAKMQKM